MDSLRSGKFLQVESGIWEIFTGRIGNPGLSYPEYRQRNTKSKNPNSRYWIPGSTAWNTEFVVVLDSLTWSIFFPVVLIVVLPLLLFSLSLPSLRFYHNMYVIPILYFFPFTFRLDNYWLYGFRRSHRRCNTSS